MLIEAGAGTHDEVKKVRDGTGLGLFVPSMVGLDREAAKRALDGFLSRACSHYRRASMMKAK